MNEPVLIEGQIKVSRALAEELAADGIITPLPVNVADLNHDEATAIYEDARRRAEELLRENTINHLAAAIVADLKADAPQPLPTNQQQVRELLGALGKQLELAAASLAWAAERLKQKGDAFGAGQVHAAALRVQAAAQGIG